MSKFLSRLQNNIIRALAEYPDIKVSRTQGRLFVILNGNDPEPIIEKCKKVFGIHSLSLAIKVNNEETSIYEGALAALHENKTAKTFKVNVRRPNKAFPIGSQEMNQRLGWYLLSNTENIKVDVHDPDIEIKVEIREKASYITTKVIKGLGGLPVGTAGKSLLLMSGGIDSPVAGYLMMKRGIKLEMIHFHSPPFTSERAKQKVLDLTKILTEYGGKIKVHLVPFTKLQQEIFKSVPDRLAMTVMRRVMLRVSEKVCVQEKILTMTTGESVGQVASQTLESMNVINEVTNFPVLRPLVALDKADIIKISEDIGTYDISIRPYEDCCTVFIPKSPATNPKREIVNAIEANLDFSVLIEDAIAGIEKLDIVKKSDVSTLLYADLL